jgi:hypothetical protein
MKGSVGYGSSDAHVVSEEINVFYLARGCNTHSWKIRGSCTRVYISTSQSSIISPASCVDPWAQPKRNLTFSEHMAGLIKNYYLQAHATHSCTYIRSGPACQVYLNHSRSPHHYRLERLQLYNTDDAALICPPVAVE